MQQKDSEKIKGFYEDIVVEFSQKYPALKSQSVGLVKVLHTYNDKIPLVQALLNYGLLSGLVLKGSSSQVHLKTVAQIKSMVERTDCYLSVAELSLDFFFYKISETAFFNK